MNYVVSGVAYGLLHSSSLRRAATVVGQRSYVYDFDYLDTGAMHCADSGLTTVAGTLDVGLHLAQATTASKRKNKIFPFFLSIFRTIRVTVHTFTATYPSFFG